MICPSCVAGVQLGEWVAGDRDHRVYVCPSCVLPWVAVDGRVLPMQARAWSALGPGERGIIEVAVGRAAIERVRRAIYTGGV